MGPALPVIAIVLAVAGIGLSTLAQVQAAEQEAEGAEAQRQILEQEAASIRDAAAAEEAKERRVTARVLAKARVKGIAAGLDPTSGTLLLNELDAAKEAELSALTVRHRGAVAARSKAQQAQFAARQRDIARGSKSLIAAGGILKAGSSVLGEFAQGGAFAGGPTTKKVTKTR